MPPLDAQGGSFGGVVVWCKFLKPEILISDVGKASPRLGEWGAPVAAAPPAASQEASLGTSALGNHFWFAACFFPRGRWHV